MRKDIKELEPFTDRERLSFRIFMLNFYWKISQSKFAKLCGISPAYLSLILNEKRKLTDKLKETFNKKLEELEKGEKA